MNPPRVLVQALVLLVVVGGVAMAGELNDAKTCYEKGLAAYALADYAVAADWYEKSFRLRPDPALLYNAAQAHRLAGNKERAVVLYQSYLRVFGHQVKNIAEVSRHIDELQRAIRAEREAVSAPPLAPATIGHTKGKPRPRPAPQVEMETRTERPLPLVATPPTEPPPAAATAPATQGPPVSREPTAAPAPTRTAQELTQTPVESRSTIKPWVWGLVAGAVVVVAVAVGLGVGLGVQPRGPSVTFGTAPVQ